LNKRFLISVVVIFVLSMAFGFLVHGLLLSQQYAKLPGLFRTEQDAVNYFPFMLLAHLFIAAGFVWIYLKGRESKPFLPQGVRFGVVVAVLMTIPMYLIYYAVQPMPGALVFKQIVFEAVGVIVMGIVVAWLNR
jgi:membrane protease YdiL (CAAX protease family)